MDTPDWTLMRAFLAVAETGSLTGAARQLGLTQPTLSRQIAALEDQVGRPLFLRLPRGLQPTETGAALVPHARAMRDAAARLTLTLAGQDEAISGTVRLSASRVVSVYVLPPILARLRQDHPAIEIELVASDSPENLLHREADIALRMFRPDGDDLITAHIADLATALYASPDYIARHGAPRSLADLDARSILGFDRSDLILRLMRSFGIEARREDFPMRCDDQIVYLELIRAGLGIGGAQRLMADRDPGLVEVAPFIPMPDLPVWLTSPAELRHNPRVRVVRDHLTKAFRALPRSVSPKGPAAAR